MFPGGKLMVRSMTFETAGSSLVWGTGVGFTRAIPVKDVHPLLTEDYFSENVRQTVAAPPGELSTETIECKVD